MYTVSVNGVKIYQSKNNRKQAEKVQKQVDDWKNRTNKSVT